MIRSFKRLSYALSLCALLLCATAARRSNAQVVRPNASKEIKVALLLRRGKLVDGSGRRPRVADVGISGDRIVFVGDAARAGVRAARTIEARGLVVAPGFIDPHTHTLEDLSDDARKSNENYLMQGVTTVVTGNDGASAAADMPITARRTEPCGT